MSQGAVGVEAVYLCVRRGESEAGLAPISDIGFVVAGMEPVPDGWVAVEITHEGRPATVMGIGSASPSWTLCYKRLPATATDADTAISDFDVIWTDKSEKPADVRWQ